MQSMQEITKAILAIQQNFDRIVYVTSGEMPDIDVLLTKTKSMGIYLPKGKEYDQCAKLIDDKAFGHSVQLNSQYLSQAHSHKCFYQGSITKYSSVLKPTNIKEIMPGLNFDERKDLTGITVEQLLSRESMSKNDTALLVLDINGAEAELKHELVTLVKVFDSLVIKTAPQSLFGETPAPMHTLSNHLKELDLVPIVLPDVSPPYVNLVVNNAKHQFCLASSHAKQKKAINELKSNLAKSQSDKYEQIAELTKQRDQQTQEQQETKQLAEELKVENETRTAKSAQQQTVIEQLTAQVNDFETKQNELVEGHKNKAAQIAELTKQRDQQTQEHQETKQLAEALKVQNDKLSADSTQQQTEKEQLVAQVAALQDTQNEQAESEEKKDVLIGALVQKRDQQVKENQDTKQHTEVLKVQNEELGADNILIKEQNEKLKAESIELKTVINELVEARKLENNNSSLRIETQVAEISKILSEKSYISSKNDDLESCIGDLDAEVVKLEAQIELVNKVFIQD